MKRIIQHQATLLLAATLLVLATSCSGPSNNTQRGAAGGAALGALAGAVIGNNRGSGNAASGAAIGAVAGAVAGGALGHRRDTAEAAQAGGGYDPESQAMTNIVAPGSPPPPPVPLNEAIPSRPSQDAVWVSGYWSFENGRSYAWVPGRWEIPQQGYRTFIPPHWIQQRNQFVYVRGYWR